MARAIQRSKAVAVEQLELEGALVVTITDLAEILRREHITESARNVAYHLQREGWLGPLRTRHAWEFLPGARAGAIGSGDRFIEFRAKLAVDPTWSGVLAMESAATLHLLAQRIPESEVVALPEGVLFPKAFVGDWRYVHLDLGPAATESINGLPTWTTEALLAGIAARPASYQDIPGLVQWLPEAVTRVSVEKLIDLLTPMNSASRQRLAYLLSAGGSTAKCEAILEKFPPVQPTWIGPRIKGGRFDPVSMVNDTLLHQFSTSGTGA